MANAGCSPRCLTMGRRRMMRRSVFGGRRRGLRGGRHAAHHKHQGPGQHGSYCRKSMDCSHQAVHFLPTGIYKDSKRNLWLRVRFPAPTRFDGTQSNTATNPHREWFAHSLRCELLHPLAVLTEPESFACSGRARVHEDAATHDVLPCVEGDQAHRRRLASLTDSSTCGPVTVNRAPSCRLGMVGSAAAAR